MKYGDWFGTLDNISFLYLFFRHDYSKLQEHQTSLP